MKILSEMTDYMPGFKRLMDSSTPDEMNALCQRFPGSFHHGKILERLAKGIQSGQIQVPE